MDKRFWGILAVIAVVFSGIFIFTKSNTANAPSTDSSKPTSHVTGVGSSGVNLTEYGDFECPACAQYYPLLKQVKETYKDEITFQFRHFPLSQLHPNAVAGSRAAEAASLQDKFWEMHDLLFENQESWKGMSNPQSAFEQYAKQLGMDTTKFMTDFKSASVNNRIQADVREGTRLGVESTPTFFIDGKKISNPTSLEAFNKVIDTAIEQKTGKKSAAQNPTTSATPAETAPAATDQ